MAGKKSLSKRGPFNDFERTELLKLMTVPCQNPECAFNSGGQPTCDLPDQKKKDYEDWCRELLHLIVAPDSTDLSEEVLALRRLRQDKVPLPCTIQAIRDFVFYDLLSNKVIPDVQKCKAAVSESSGRVNTLYEKWEELGVKQVAELASFTPRVSSYGLFEEKQNLLSLIERALSASQEIYKYELEELERMNRDSFSWAQALHLELTLPVEITSKGARYWKEIATLMTLAREVWRLPPRNVQGESRTYTKRALEKLSERFTEEERRKLREALSKDIPNLFPKIFELNDEKVRELFASARCFKPSEKVEETMKIARAVRDGEYGFQPESPFR